MPNKIDHDYSTGDQEGSLRMELISGDLKRQRIAAALVRAHFNVRQQAREAGVGILIGRGNDVLEVDPDSPVFAEMDELVELAEQLFPTKQK